MAYEVVHINGKHPKVNYDTFESDIKKLFGNKVDAKVYIFNGFPAALDTDFRIDVLLIIAIRNVSGNYIYMKNVADKSVYLHNLVIPLYIKEEFEEVKIKLRRDSLNTIDYEINFERDFRSVQFQLSAYLKTRCGLEAEPVFVHPLIFIVNEKKQLTNYIVSGPQLRFNEVINFFKANDTFYLNSYRPWSNPAYFTDMSEDVNLIVEQLALDSEEGYITKSKIERFAKQLAQPRRIFDELGSKIVIVEGKAGSGKSSELLLATLKTLENGKNVMFLTYNKLLVYELSREIKAYNNTVAKLGKETKVAGGVRTIHKYMYHITGRLGVRHLISEVRIEELTIQLKERMPIIQTFFDAQEGEIDYEVLKTKLQGKDDWYKPIKDLSIVFTHFLKRNGVATFSSAKAHFEKFISEQAVIYAKLGAQEIFMKDYYGLLKATLDILLSPKSFYEKYNVKNKVYLLEFAFGLSDYFISEEDGKEVITEDKFVELIKRKVSGFEANRALFVDEAQDCHPDERDILLCIFRKYGVVVSNGGKEQLIRHVELCNWKISFAKKLESITLRKSKTFRMKRTIAEFVNYLGIELKIDMDLNFLESDDEGEVIIDIRGDSVQNSLAHMTDQLLEKGKAYGCSPNESIMIMQNASDSYNATKHNNHKVNYFGNTVDEYQKDEENLEVFNALKDHYGYELWNGLGDHKDDLIPYSSNIRYIYYESCRGLEAWNTICLNIDEFFERKRAEEMAERFLIEDERQSGIQDMYRLSNEERKIVYAGTWLMMALTRAIDTIYLTVNPDSFLGTKIMKFASENNSKVKVLK